MSIQRLYFQEHMYGRSVSEGHVNGNGVNEVSSVFSSEAGDEEINVPVVQIEDDDGLLRAAGRRPAERGGDGRRPGDSQVGGGGDGVVGFRPASGSLTFRKLNDKNSHNGGGANAPHTPGTVSRIPYQARPHTLEENGDGDTPTKVDY